MNISNCRNKNSEEWWDSPSPTGGAPPPPLPLLRPTCCFVIKENQRGMEKPSGDDYTPPLTAATVWRDVPEANRLVTVDFFERQVAACPVAADCLRKDFYSHLILSLLEVDLVERGRISCFFSVNPAVANFFGGLHGGAVAAISEAVSIACARTVVAEDNELFLGELGMSYLSAAPKNAKLIVNASVIRSGRTVTIIGVEFKMRETSKLIYTAHATLYTMPTAKL